MDKTITVTLKERNLISFVLDQLALNGSITVDEISMFNYSMRDISKIRDKILYGNEI